MKRRSMSRSALECRQRVKSSGIAEMIKRDLAHARHDAHVEHDIDAVGHLNPNFAERRAPGAHEKRNDIQRASAHRAGINFRQLVVGFGGGHPVVVRACIFLPLRADEGQVLGACDIIEGTAMQIATR